MAIPAPPSTAFGMLATTAANLGNKPNRIKITPDAATTKRLLTRVTAIRPTFCANAVYGKLLRIPPITVERPSARIMDANSLRPIFLSTISPIAILSPVVSTITTSITIIIEMTDAQSNVGKPK